jgi:UDP-N-acetyl-D-mannosaminuronate dehydrogenase
MTRQGRNINDSMPAYCVGEAIKLLGKGKDISQSIVALLGLAFRGGVSDTRLSPTYKVIEELKKYDITKIRIHDPLVKSDPLLSPDIVLTSDLSQAVKDADLIILIADHPQYYKIIGDDLHKVPVYDGRGILDRAKFYKFTSIGTPR